MLTEEKIKRIKRIHQQKKKSLIRNLWKQWEELNDARWALPYIKLETPYQNGFKKSFVLRDDIANRKDADVFLRILGVINTTVYSRDAGFKRTVKTYARDHRNRLIRKKAIQDIPIALCGIGKGQWEKLGWPEHFKKWFVYRISTVISPWGFTSSFEGWHFKYEYYFVPHVEPHFITHVRQLDPDLEAKVKELSNRIERNNLWPKIDHILHGSCYYNKDDWYQSKMIQLESDKAGIERDINKQTAEYLSERAFEDLLNLFARVKYGYEAEPYNDPNYEFK